MKHSTIYWNLLLVLTYTVSCCCSFTVPTTTNIIKQRQRRQEIMVKKYTPQEQEAIDAVSFYGEMLNSENVDGVVEAYASDGVFYPYNLPTASGSDEIRTSYTNIFQMIKLNVKFVYEDVIVNGDLATVITSSAGKVFVKGPAIEAPEANREVFVLKKVDGGKFKIAHYMFNKSEAPPS